MSWKECQSEKTKGWPGEKIYTNLVTVMFRLGKSKKCKENEEHRATVSSFSVCAADVVQG